MVKERNIATPGFLPDETDSYLIAKELTLPMVDTSLPKERHIQIQDPIIMVVSCWNLSGSESPKNLFLGWDLDRTRTGHQGGRGRDVERATRGCRRCHSNLEVRRVGDRRVVIHVERHGLFRLTSVG
jgi:hypothetical protein